MLSLSNPAFRTYALASVVLFVYLIVLANWTVKVRNGRKVFVNKEDADLSKGTLADAEHPDVLRIKRAHLNALENVPAFWIIGLLYVLTGATPLGAAAYFWTFTGTRLLHGPLYLAGKQPWRSVMYAVNVFALLGMAVHIVRAAV